MSNLLPAPTALPIESKPQSVSLESYTARETDIGGLTVHRALPNRKRRLIGAWCFLDHYGPLTFNSGKPMDVGPHPHIGLQTVTWLFSGEVLHKDSLASEQLIVPGQLNLMTAGRGIAHSEETPLKHTSKLHGLQFWVALPEKDRNTKPGFHHHSDLPEIEFGPLRVIVFLGALGNTRSPAHAYSEIVGAEIISTRSGDGEVPIRLDFEHAILPIEGRLVLKDSVLQPDVLYYLGSSRETLPLNVSAHARFLLFGGVPFNQKILMWWNFVARTPEEIADARMEWEQGTRFGNVTRYTGDRIPAPPFLVRPKI